MAKIPTASGDVSPRGISGPRMGGANIGPAVAAAGRAAGAARSLRAPQIQIPAVRPDQIDTSPISAGMMKLAGVSAKKRDERDAFKNRLFIENASASADEELEKWYADASKDPTNITARTKVASEEIYAKYEESAPNQAAALAIRNERNRSFLGKMPRTLGLEAAANLAKRDIAMENRLALADSKVFDNPDEGTLAEQRMRLQSLVEVGVAAGDYTKDSKRYASYQQSIKNLDRMMVDSMLAKSFDNEELLPKAKDFVVKSDNLTSAQKKTYLRQIDSATDSRENEAVRDFATKLKKEAAFVRMHGAPSGEVDMKAAAEHEELVPFIRDVENQKTLYEVTTSLAGESLQTISARLDEVRDSGEFATALQDEQLVSSLSQWARSSQAEMKKDPGGWVAKNVAVQPLWDEYTNATDPASQAVAWAKYSKSSRELQLRAVDDGGFGMSPSMVQLFPKSMLTGFASIIKNDSSQLGQHIEGMLSKLGTDDFNLFVDRLGDLPGSDGIDETVRVIASGAGDPRLADQRQWLIDAHNMTWGDVGVSEAAKTQAITAVENDPSFTSWFNNRLNTNEVEARRQKGQFLDGLAKMVAIRSGVNGQQGLSLRDATTILKPFMQSWFGERYFMPDDGGVSMRRDKIDGNGRIIQQYGEDQMQQANQMLDILRLNVRESDLATLGITPRSKSLPPAAGGASVFTSPSSQTKRPSTGETMEKLRRESFDLSDLVYSKEQMRLESGAYSAKMEEKRRYLRDAVTWQSSDDGSSFFASITTPHGNVPLTTPKGTIIEYTTDELLQMRDELSSKARNLFAPIRGE